MKYIVSADCNNKGAKEIASFGKRSDALDYASSHKNVTITRKTPYTNRVVFSRKVTENNGFVTVSETETFRANKV
jgi:hypothetical protein